MRKAITLGLIVAALTTGCGKKEDSNQNNVQYFNSNSRVPVGKSTQPSKPIEYKKISYNALVNIVRENGGTFEIDMSTVDVGRSQSTNFANYGYGFAWANKMQGNLEDNIYVQLSTVDVGRSQSTDFTNYGYGFAWANIMQGNIGGNKFRLVSTKVEKSKYTEFFNYGYGFANTEEMTGNLGNLLSVNYKCNQIGKDRSTNFAEYGYGFAWAKEGKLTISLK